MMTDIKLFSGDMYGGAVYQAKKFVADKEVISVSHAVHIENGQQRMTVLVVYKEGVTE